MSMLNTSDAHLPFPILIGDIGGTNARFSILADAAAEAVNFPNVRTADFKTIDEAILMGVFAKTDMRPRAAILAVAGPINGDEIPLTNCDWIVRPHTMLEGLGIEDVIVINDFEAQALAISALGENDRERIGTASRELVASRVVLGPGTGLGVGGLVHAQGSWIPVPGEGGHVDLGPRSMRDLEIFPYIETIEGRVAAEQILCGRGIVNLYRAICKADGIDSKYRDPADITSHALAETDKTAVETISLFSTYLGRLAGDLAMIFMAKGGVYLSGGISQKILPALRRSEFRAAFEDKAPHSHWLRAIPTYVVTHPLAALAGLSFYARQPASFGVSTEGRRWRR
ncbi:glucokinase [Rhizobium sp. SEMIA 4085]|uniref:Glucokinase n=1 Tax=Rhizobium gallicum bv. gallicum R602sp TaxID=1041138 RepID=A0A0B4WZ73_9HYPH|nr:MULTISPECIES: glucokinase [Rhizobium]AJD39567.1 glucokinase [Rhizobium gallicum bv. gallicum R602sp]NNH29628.1 glucokinase [Rhizobium sp. SEMIA 4085]TDW37372.1 glucokinase [Rhizobium azibense]